MTDSAGTLPPTSLAVDAGHTFSPHAERYRPSPHSLANRLIRALWGITWLFLFRLSPRPFYGWRRFLLRVFGARIGHGAIVHASARVWAPWNLEMGTNSCLSFGVECYAVDRITIGSYATVSQFSFLCAAGHDIDSADMTLTTAPIVIGDHAWVAADAFIGPGVTIAEGAVVGARASVFKDVPPWMVVAGNPARRIRRRSRAVAQGSYHGAER